MTAMLIDMKPSIYDGAQRPPVCAWAAVALTEEVTGDKPLGVTWGEMGYVLFRDQAGEARALEDRCPHRRAPLSLGRIRPEGLQCGYHGWTFDGATGACRVIPNLRADEKIPQHYVALSFPVVERDGFVWLKVRDGLDEAPAIGDHAVGRQTHGVSAFSLDCSQYLAAWLDGPELLLDTPGLKITDYGLGDPVEDADELVRDCGVAWRTLAWPAPFVTDYPLVLRVRLALATGQVVAELRTRDEKPVASLRVAPAPGPRGTTSVRWRACVFGPAATGARGALTGLASGFGRRPSLSLKPFVAGAALAATLPGPSVRYRSRIAALAVTGS